MSTCSEKGFVVFLLIFIQEILTQMPIQTTLGPVQGTIVRTTDGDEVTVYYGIPFAKAPIGNLRFRHPIPIEPWSKTFNANVKPSSCWQPIDTTYGNFRGATMWNANTDMSEDCLKLNIWIPKLNNGESQLPVLVWIFGGGFVSGTSTLDIYDGKILASEGQVIVVSMNYRVGALGFLYFGNQGAPGNAGMFDQIMALQWIQDNIESFGGDPGKVTLFGESAGAVSVDLLQLSPLSRHLFSNIILQSGSSTASWGLFLPSELRSNSYKLARKLNCSYAKHEHDKLVECLRAKSPEAFVNILIDVPANELVKFPFAPVVEGYFLTKTPSQYISEGDFKNCPILAGSNRDEGNYFIIYGFPNIYPKIENLKLSEENFTKYVKKIRPSFKNSLVYSAIMFQYTNWLDTKDSQNYIDLMDKIVGDLYFTCPVNEVLNAYSNNGSLDLYMYNFVHRSYNHPWPKWMGVIHADEITYIFGEPLLPGKGYTEEEKNLSRNIIRYWSNFAKYGNPNSPPERIWPTYKVREEKYFVLDTNMDNPVKSGLRTKFCAFWKHYVPQLVNSNLEASCRTSRGQAAEFSHQFIIVSSFISVLLSTFYNS